MIRGKYFWNGDDLTNAYLIRKKVFVQEQKMSEKNVFDSLDAVSVHAVVFDEDENPVASGRVAVYKDEYRIGKIAVLKESRGQGFGEFLVKMLVDKAYLAGASTVKVRAQKHAVTFYKKIGFIECGDPFEDLDGLHVQPMELVKGSLCKGCKSKDKTCKSCSNELKFIE